MHLDRARHCAKAFCFGQSWPLLLSYFLTSHMNKRIFLEMGIVITRENKQTASPWGWCPVCPWPGSRLSVRVTGKLLLTEAGQGAVGLWSQFICHSPTSGWVPCGGPPGSHVAPPMQGLGARPTVTPAAAVWTSESRKEAFFFFCGDLVSQLPTASTADSSWRFCWSVF